MKLKCNKLYHKTQGLLTNRHDPKVVLDIHRRPACIALVNLLSFQSKHLWYAWSTYVNIQKPNLQRCRPVLPRVKICMYLTCVHIYIIYDCEATLWYVSEFVSNRSVLNSRVKLVCKGKTYFFAFGSKRKRKLRREGTLADTSLSRQN